VRVLRAATVVTFFGLKPIEKGLSPPTENPTDWIVGVDVFMKKQCDLPVATTKRLGGATGFVVFMKRD
jgi:hypothetical protein